MEQGAPPLGSLGRLKVTWVRHAATERENWAICCSVNTDPEKPRNVEWWELEYEVSWRPRQVVYIRTETDISALTNPNKKQAVCYPASAGGGDKERREEERGGRMSG